MNSVALNVGDAAILQGLMRAVRDALGADTIIEVAEQFPEVALRLYPEVAFYPGFHSARADWPRWRRRGIVASLRKRRTTLAVRLLGRAPRLARRLLTRVQREHVDRMARADAVIATGGTYFVEHYGLRGKADEVRAAQALGRPVFLFTQSLGPFRRRRNAALMRRLIDGCAGVFLRDTRSRAHLEAVGAPMDRVSVHADAAFALASPDGVAPRAGPDVAPAAGAGRRRVAISVRDWRHFREGSEPGALARYREAVAGAARTLAREGCEVVFLSTCQGVPEYWADDSRFAWRLVAELLAGEPRIRVDSAFRSPEALAAELATFDLAIATRMHFAILALSVATPVVAIAYEFKSRELLKAMGREGWAFDIEEVRADALVRAAREALAGGAALRAEVAQQVSGFAEEARRPAAVIATVLGAGRADR